MTSTIDWPEADCFAPSAVTPSYGRRIHKWSKAGYVSPRYTRTQVEAIVAAELAKRVPAMQARIDELMLEYCPDEMTPQQMETWAEHQVPYIDPRDAEITKLRKVIDCVVVEASGSISYLDDTDSIGFHVCCDVISYEPHADDCYMKAAIDAAKEWA